MFTKLYLSTTNPNQSFSKMLSQNIHGILISTVFHTVAYLLFVNAVSYAFLGRLLPIKINKRLAVVLLLIMFFGYMARFYHVKEVYNAYRQNAVNTRNHLDKLYITWLFIA